MQRPFDQPIHTEGGAVVGGDVHAGRDVVLGDQINITGDGNVVGDHSSATVIKQVTEGITVEGFLQLMEHIRQQLPAARLDGDIEDIVDADVRVIEQQASKEKPSKPIILSKLKGVTELLTEMGKVVAAATALAALAEKAITWA